MTKKAMLGTFMGAAIVLASGLAVADDEFDVSAGKGTVTVVAKGAWHVNKEYPWKVIAGDTKIDKSKFTLTEKSASVSGVPAGVVHVKGAMCEGTSCKTFTKDVTVQ
jgi:hypothetical protein